MKSALLIVDLQNDFCTGNLIVPGALNVIPKINEIIANEHFDMIIFSKDYHPINHCSFIEQGGEWEPHCIIDTSGAELTTKLKCNKNYEIVTKGSIINYDSYSAFYNAEQIKKENNLRELLTVNDINTLYICGVAIEYCVFFTVMDAIKFGYDVYFINNASAGINNDNIKTSIEKMKYFGAKVINF